MSNDTFRVDCFGAATGTTRASGSSSSSIGTSWWFSWFELSISWLGDACNGSGSSFVMRRYVVPNYATAQLKPVLPHDKGIRLETVATYFLNDLHIFPQCLRLRVFAIIQRSTLCQSRKPLNRLPKLLLRQRHRFTVCSESVLVLVLMPVPATKDARISP